MNVLAFDLATSTGWAFGSPDGVAASGSIRLPSTGLDIGRFLVAARGAYQDLILVDRRPDRIVFEQPILGGATQLHIKRKLYCLAGIVEMIAVEAAIPVAECNIGDVRVHFLGRGYPRKSEKAKLKTIVTCRRRGWNPKDGDEADALACLDYALACLSPVFAQRSTPLFAHA